MAILVFVRHIGTYKYIKKKSVLDSLQYSNTVILMYQKIFDYIIDQTNENIRHTNHIMEP